MQPQVRTLDCNRGLCLFVCVRVWCVCACVCVRVWCVCGWCVCVCVCVCVCATLLWMDMNLIKVAAYEPNTP
jgi:hypothetical protein